MNTDFLPVCFLIAVFQVHNTLCETVEQQFKAIKRNNALTNVTSYDLIKRDRDENTSTQHQVYELKVSLPKDYFVKSVSLAYTTSTSGVVPVDVSLYRGFSADDLCDEQSATTTYTNNDTDVTYTRVELAAAKPAKYVYLRWKHAPIDIHDIVVSSNA